MTVTAPRDQVRTNHPRRARLGSPRPWIALVAFVAVAQAAGLIGIPFTDRVAGGWYDQLDKPSFNPPSWVFAPVWTTLYVLMGIAAWRVWRLADSHARTVALGLWALQLVFNALWSPLFFGAHQDELALVDIGLLLVTLTITLVHFARLDRLAGALLVPYLGWVTFATVLNAAFVALN